MKAAVTNFERYAAYMNTEKEYKGYVRYQIFDRDIPDELSEEMSKCWLCDLHSRANGVRSMPCIMHERKLLDLMNADEQVVFVKYLNNADPIRDDFIADGGWSGWL